jgi:arylsulfatase A-like enzyme
MYGRVERAGFRRASSPFANEETRTCRTVSRPPTTRIENTGALNTKRMETVDEEFLASAFDFLDRKSKEGKPWFCYVNPTRMHVCDTMSWA